MATGRSGNFTLTGTIGGVGVKVYWSETYDIATNKSVVSITPKMVCTGSGGGYRYYLDGPFSINGTEVVKMSSVAGSHNSYVVYGNEANINAANSSYKAPPWSLEVTHNSDGSKSVVIAVNISGYTTDGKGASGFRISGSQTIDLTTIPRTSSVSALDGKIGTALNINISRASSTFTHTLKYAFGSTSGTIAAKTASTTVSWAPPMSLCSQIPKAVTAECTITCETYSGTTLIGSSTCKMKLTVPDSVVLKCSSGWAAVNYYNTGTKAESIAAYVRGYSKAQVSFDSSKISTADSYGATIASYKIVLGDKSYTASPYRTDTISTAGKMTVDCYVYDTRGRSVKTSLSFTVQEYANAAMKDISIYRSTSNGTASDTGTYITVKATAVISSIDGQNNLTLKARYRAIGGSYSGYVTLTSGVASQLGPVLTTSSYDVEIVAADSLGNSAVFTGRVPTEAWSFKIKRGGKGAAFGKVPEEDNVLDVAWQMKIQGEYLSDFVIARGTDGIWTWEKWLSGKAVCYGRSSYPDASLTTQWGSSGIYVYVIPNRINYPAGLFLDAPKEFAKARGGYAMWEYSNGDNTNTQTSVYGFARAQLTTTPFTVNLDLYAIGRWK